MPKKIRACFQDTVQHTASRAYALQIHLILQFDAPLCVERLRQALRLLLDREPVFGSRFVLGWWRPFWQQLSPAELDAAVLLREAAGNPDDLARTRDAFLAEIIDEAVGPQLRGLLLHESSGNIATDTSVDTPANVRANTRTNTLIIKVNHQVVDAGGTKALGYLLADIYNRLAVDENYRVEPNRGSRSLRQVYGQFGPWRLAVALAGFGRDIKNLIIPFKTRCFPSGDHADGPWRFVVKRFDSRRVSIIRRFCHERQATINDLLVATLLRAISEVSDGEEDRALRLITTVDLRRYLPAGKTEALCNLSGFLFPNIGRDLGDDLDQTLRRVKAHIDTYKQGGNIGLSFMPVVWLSGLLVPYALIRRFVPWVFNKIASTGNIVPVVTNLGRIRRGELDFGGLFPINAEALAPPVIPPFFGLGLSGYRDSLTFSCGFFPSAVPPTEVEQLLDAVEHILPGSEVVEKDLP